MSDEDPMRRLRELDEGEREVCDACFLACVAWHGGRRYPCSDELRNWAREHRDEPGTYEEDA